MGPFAFGCGSSGSAAGAPEAALSAGHGAQQAFRKLSTHWQARSALSRASLEPELRKFLVRYGTDPRARQVRAYLAWVTLDRGDLVQAEQLARSVRNGPAGPVRDLATVITAAIERRQGRPERALELLAPLHGKIIDPSERLLETSELVRSLLVLKRHDAALDAMVDWIETAPDIDRDGARKEVEALLAEIPAPVLEDRLKQPAGGRRGESRERIATLKWLDKSVRQRLVRAALTDRDVALAKRLLEENAALLQRDAESEALARLASEGRVAPRVTGRAVGVVLRLGSEEAQRRSAQVASGVSRALGVAEAAARPDGVRVVLREASDVEYVDSALAGLAGDGAAILVAGVTAADAAIASQFAERAKMPVILLVAPERSAPADGYSFVVGIGSQRDREVLESALSERSIAPVGWVGTTEAPCGADVPAGASAFPVDSWKKEDIEGLVLLGDALCSEDAVRLALERRLQPALFLGLESAHAWPDLPARQRYVVTTGSFPWIGNDKAPADLRAWKDRAGKGPSWYEALGHDAALLAAAGLSALPLERTDEATQVAELHEKAARALAKARAPLWTAESKGFDGSRALSRSFSVAPIQELGR